MQARYLLLTSGLMLLASESLRGQGVADRPTGPVDRCVSSDCHGDKLVGKVLHAPSAQRKCDACHLLADAAEHRFTLTVDKAKLCTACHVQTYRDVVHQPVADGDCTGCHDPHGSDHRFSLLDDPVGGLCGRCHKPEEFTGKKHVHGPVAAGACILCHEVHSSWHPRLLVKPEQDLCVSCHEDVIADLELYRHVHPPVVQGRCATCHDPHASDHPAQLRRGAPEICFSCHEHDAIKRKVETSQHQHGALGTEVSCTGCHAGHGSAMPKLLAQPLMSLCLSCHDKPVETKDNRRLTDMALLLKDNPDHHGPVRRADCAACHDPHASPNFKLLAGEYPEMFYAPFDLKNYDLCFTCHIKELVTVETSLGVTGFRHGERNLHFVHVNKEKKGRTCRACHEVHASKRPFHMREKVPFGDGGWEIEVNFEKRPDGGRCAPGCHEEEVYRRQGVVSTKPAQPKAGAEP